MYVSIKRERFYWQAFFFCFLLAALTGVLYRLGMIATLPDMFGLENIRHAHSHLMFFGWAGALPLYAMMVKIGGKAGGAEMVFGLQMMKLALWGVLLFGLLSYPFFLLYGYHPVTIGNASLPLSVILSGLVMICWYLFIAGYLSARRAMADPERNRWFEAALVMLFLSSLGAWGVAAVQFFHVENLLAGRALTHFFLACFTEGWVVLATVGLLDEALDVPAGQYPFAPGTLAAMILLGAPLTFSYGISESLLTPLMLNAARFGGIVTGVGLAIIAYTILKTGNARKTIFVWPLFFLLLKALLQVLASITPSGFWLSDYGLRIFYLHILLLGGFTLGGIGYLHRRMKPGRASFNWVIISIVILLVSLLLLTRLWPIGWGGEWIFYVVAAASVLPVVAVLNEWIRLRGSNPAVSNCDK